MSDGAHQHYTVRESPRAKHVRLRVSLRDGSLCIVIPKGFDRREIPSVLAEKRPWIERTQRRVAEQRQQMDPTECSGPPAVIRLRAIDEEWRVEYRRRGVQAHDGDEGRPTVCIYGAVDDADGCTQAVGRWLHRKARAHLTPWLADLSARHRMPIAGIAIRSQRTRWGSCSAQNRISLNQKLLFLPAHLAEQVMLHELCHTVHHNHSSRFWQLLLSLSPDSRSLEAELRTAWRFVPAWASR